ncbi:MAG: hypothetical protein KJ025_09875 [Burkholderiales bacterium]|nr:hypothetical protein [Burkholderiales bacterium]
MRDEMLRRARDLSRAAGANAIRHADPMQRHLRDIDAAMKREPGREQRRVWPRAALGRAPDEPNA